MKAAWTWSLAVFASLGAGFSGEARATDVFSQSTTVRRPVAVDFKDGIAKQDKEKTAFGCYGGIGCSPYGCGVGVGVGFGGCGIGNCGYGGGCGYGYGRRGRCGGCGPCGGGCSPCGGYSSICAPCGNACSPCGGYGISTYGPAYIGGGCGVGGCGYGGYGVAPIAAPVYTTPGCGIAPCGGYGAGYGVGYGAGYAPAPYYGVYGSNYSSADADDSDTMPVANQPQQRGGRVMMRDRDDSPYFRSPARSYERQYGPQD